VEVLHPVGELEGEGGQPALQAARCGLRAFAARPNVREVAPLGRRIALLQQPQRPTLRTVSRLGTPQQHLEVLLQQSHLSNPLRDAHPKLDQPVLDRNAERRLDARVRSCAA